MAGSKRRGNFGEHCAKITENRTREDPADGLQIH
jgi:hypothetical protein